MATIVCQGLQSCLDSPQLVEPRTLRLKLSSSISHHFSQPFDLSTLKSRFSDAKTNEPAEKCHYGDLIKEQPNHHHENQTSKSSEMGGWSFLQSLPNSQSSKLDKEQTYVHPLVKRSSSSLSEKSLKLCTENLGNETGTDMSESGILSNISCAESKSEDFSQQRLAARKMKSPRSSARSFPPPLTTMSGAESLQVRPHREDGRLIIKAIKTPPRSSCFHAERSHGRLRLCFLENYTPTFDSGERVSEEEDESYENDTIEEEEGNLKAEEEEEEEEVEEQVGERCWGSEEIDEKKLEVEGKMGIENFERPNRRRCNEGGEHENKTLMLNWDHFWVATS
ncbi:The fantastic four family [Parasponia andersonii]|uniref:The fantastic four family n=1 Tax=Parasponia andersonii TaxID=3476 RepID=A0A2P5E3L8_PARAD|nr:The fantastic four family [Parasponia andersonii]